MSLDLTGTVEKRQLLLKTYNKLAMQSKGGNCTIDEDLVEMMTTTRPELESLFTANLNEGAAPEGVFIKTISELADFEVEDIEKIISAYLPCQLWNGKTPEERMQFIMSAVTGLEQGDAASAAESNHIEEITLEELKKINLDLNDRRLPNLVEILPQGHFINKVTRWMSGLSDTYYEYQVLAALWLLSDLIQGKGSLRLRTGEIKPNLYVILFGQSTKSRKSTAIKKIKQIRESATNIDFFNDEPTIEGYLEMLAENPVQSFVCDEASGLLSKYHKKYNDGIFDLECKIYDGESVRKIKASGQKSKVNESIVKNPYVTHLYATTPDKFCSIMSLDDFLCGYGYRWLYAFPTYQKDRMDIDLEDEENVEAWAEVLTAVRVLYKKYREIDNFNFTIAKDALNLFNTIGKELEDEAEKKQDESLDSAVARTEDNILKVAMLLEIGKEDPSHEITEYSVAVASVLAFDFFLPSFMQMMDRLLSDVKNNKIEKAIAVIRRMGGYCTRSTLIKNGHFTAKECDEVIEAMVIGRIVEEKQIKETKSRTYILISDAKPLTLQSTETSELFAGLRTIRTLRRLRTFAQDIETPAKSAKSRKENKEVSKNRHMTGAMRIGITCESAKPAKFAKPAKSEHTPQNKTEQEKREEKPSFVSSVVSAEEADRILEEEGY